MKWILFVTLFTTAPYNPPKDLKEDFAVWKERTRLWTLQTATSSEFATRKGCIEAGGRLFSAMRPVATVTFRGYCLCESTDAANRCPPDDDLKTVTPDATARERDTSTSTSIEVIGPANSPRR